MGRYRKRLVVSVLCQMKSSLQRLDDALERFFASNDSEIERDDDDEGNWNTWVDDVIEKLTRFQNSIGQIPRLQPEESKSILTSPLDSHLEDTSVEEIEFPIKEEVPDFSDFDNNNDPLEQQELEDLTFRDVEDSDDADPQVSSGSFYEEPEVNDAGSDDDDGSQRSHQTHIPRKKRKKTSDRTVLNAACKVLTQPQNEATSSAPEPNMKDFTLVVKRMTRSDVKKHTRKKLDEAETSKLEVKGEISNQSISLHEPEEREDAVFDMDIDEYESDDSDYIPAKIKRRNGPIRVNKTKKTVVKECSSKLSRNQNRKKQNPKTSKTSGNKGKCGGLPAGTELTQEQITINEQIEAFDWTTLEGSTFQCFLCPYKSNYRRILGRHLMKHKFEVGLECPVCCKHPMKNQMALRNHVKEKHPRNYQTLYRTAESMRLCAEDYGFVEDDLKNVNLEGISDTKYPFKCPVCGAPKRTHTMAIYHIDSHNPNGLCTYCGKTVPAAYLTTHIKKQHLEKTDKTFNCPDPLCSKSFSSKDRLRGHIVSAHRSLDEEAVPACFKDFESKRGKINLGPLVCATCGEKFRTYKTLNTHKSIHTGERRFLCEHPGCTKVFTQKRILVRHQSVHCTERNVKCPECDMTFKHTSSMYSHKRKYHPKDREAKFSCTKCSLAFTTKGFLTQHYQKEHLNQGKEATFELTPEDVELNNRIHNLDLASITGPPFLCFVCSYEAIGRHHLKRHFYVHLKEKPLKCPECNSDYRNAIALKEHLRNFHPDSFFRLYGSKKRKSCEESNN